MDYIYAVTIKRQYDYDEFIYCDEKEVAWYLGIMNTVIGRLNGIIGILVEKIQRI